MIFEIQEQKSLCKQELLLKILSRSQTFNMNTVKRIVVVSCVTTAAALIFNVLFHVGSVL